MQILTFLAGALFMLLAVTILLGSHFLVYYSLVNFFRIASSNAKTILGITIFFLAISFIIASILAHWQENIFTRSFYFLASLWLGLLNSLFWAFIFGWLSLWLAGKFGWNFNIAAVGALAFVLALIYSGYGTWNAYSNQVIKNVTVKIKDLPVEWQGKTVVQISDAHLGHIFRQDFLKKIVNMANSVKPEAVFITGDLFDGMDGDLSLSVKPLDGLNAPQGVFFITGNHETYFGVKRVFDILSNTKVKILNDEMTVVNGLQIIGVSYPERGLTKNMTETIKKLTGFDPAKPSILLYHSPTHIAEVKASGINLQLSGHTHKGQMLPFNLITYLVYRGYDYGLREEGDFSIYTTNGAGAWGPTMRTGNTPEIVAIRLEAK